MLLDGGFVPVIAPIGVGEEGASYNINADTAAGRVAEALLAEKLLLLTDTAGILGADGKLIREVGIREVDELIAILVASASTAKANSSHRGESRRGSPT